VLQQRVTEAIEHCGFTPESRRYHPHITLARIKGRDTRQEIRKFKSRIDAAKTVCAFVADEILLYESQLGADGSKYEVRARFPLDG
jgi:2'-5' RNA ligase